MNSLPAKTLKSISSMKTRVLFGYCREAEETVIQKAPRKMPYLVANCAPRCLWGGRRRENIARMIDTLEGLCSICLEPIMPSDPVVSVNSAEIHRRCYTGEGPKLVPNPPAKRKPNSN